MENYQDKIDAYLNGQMPFVDKLNFEAELESNSELKDLYQFTLLLQNELQDRAQKSEKINLWREDNDTIVSEDSEVYTEHDYSESKNNKRIQIYHRIWWAVAAVLLLLIIISLPNTNKHNHSNIAHYGSKDSINQTNKIINIEHLEEVSSNKNNLEDINLTIEEQQIYWAKAERLQQQGKREESVRYLKILLRQEGVYHYKADSLMQVIYQSQK